MKLCSFYSFGDKFLDEIIHAKSPIALSMQDYLPANGLKFKITHIYSCIYTGIVTKSVEGELFSPASIRPIIPFNGKNDR